MPKLNEYIAVGFCAGYGDGDYRVSAAITTFSREQMNELLLATFHAQRAAWDMWCRYQKSDEASFDDLIASGGFADVCGEHAEKETDE